MVAFQGAISEFIRSACNKFLLYHASIFGSKKPGDKNIMIPFASIDPAKGKLGAREARRLVREFGIKGFKFHPTVQGFYPNDRSAYPLYEAIAENNGIALFHTGQTGVGDATIHPSSIDFLPLYINSI